jgi:hypothetical protein
MCDLVLANAKGQGQTQSGGRHQTSSYDMATSTATLGPISRRQKLIQQQQNQRRFRDRSLDSSEHQHCSNISSGVGGGEGGNANANAGGRRGSGSGGFFGWKPRRNQSQSENDLSLDTPLPPPPPPPSLKRRVFNKSPSPYYDCDPFSCPYGGPSSVSELRCLCPPNPCCDPHYFQQTSSISTSSAASQTQTQQQQSNNQSNLQNQAKSTNTTSGSGSEGNKKGPQLQGILRNSNSNSLRRRERENASGGVGDQMQTFSSSSTTTSTTSTSTSTDCSVATGPFPSHHHHHPLSHSPIQPPLHSLEELTQLGRQRHSMPSEFYDASSLAYCQCDDFYRTLPLPNTSGGSGVEQDSSNTINASELLLPHPSYYDNLYDDDDIDASTTIPAPTSYSNTNNSTTAITTNSPPTMFNTYVGVGSGGASNVNSFDDCNPLDPLMYNATTMTMGNGPLSLPLNLNRSPRGTFFFNFFTF